MSTSATEKQGAQPQYELLYHPKIPGRGEFIRLPLEAAGIPYIDLANEKKNGYDEVRAICMNQNPTCDSDGNPPVFAPPALRISGAGKDGKSLVIHQTPNILFYLGPRIGMAPENEADLVHVNQVALTALDLNNETHDTHHPVSSDYYESQKEEALRAADDYRKVRLPKYLSYFERSLKGNEALGHGKYLVGDKLSYADTTVWHVLDGILYAFPKEMAARKDDFPLIFTKFYPSFKEEKNIKEYLSSKRRLPYSVGIFRHYPELDRQS